MSKAIKPEDLGKAVQNELTLYHKNVLEGMGEAAHSAIKKLTNITRKTAPKGARGSYKRHISWMQNYRNTHSVSYLWYVRAPDYRLTHLLVHGHAKKNGGRTKSNPFLANALDAVLPEYERAVEEVIKNGK